MSAIIECAFVNSVINTDYASDSGSNSGSTTPKGFSAKREEAICAQHDTMEKRISGLRMWLSKSVVRDKSGYVSPRLSLQSHPSFSLEYRTNRMTPGRPGVRRHLRHRSPRIPRRPHLRTHNTASMYPRHDPHHARPRVLRRHHRNR